MGTNNGADVVNIRAGTRVNSTYKNNKEIGEGVYYADTTFGNYNTWIQPSIFINGYGND